MSADAIVQKYSQALFDVTESVKKSEAVAQELQQATPLFDATDVKSFFSSPFNSADNKLMVAKSALEGKCSPELFNFLITLVEKERVALIAQINTAYQALVRAKGGESEGVLYVAGEASEAFVAQVEQLVSKALNKKTKLSVQKDPTLLAGYKVSVGGWTMDDSAQFHLTKLKEEISRRSL